MPPISDERLEELKEALRRRGYLDRVILRDAAAPWGWLKGSLKAAGLAAVVLDLAFVVMLAFLGSPPLASAGDAFLLALYLAPICGLLTLAVELAAGALTRLLESLVPSGRGHSARLAWGIGGVIALGFAIYLSLWWRGRGETGGHWARIGFVVFILLISLFLGRLASLTAWLSLLRVGRMRGLGKAGGRFQAILVALLIVVIAGALWRSHRETVPSAAAGRFSTAPVSGRTLWIGVDGLGSSLMRAMAREGHLPRLAARAGAGCTVSLQRPAAEPPAIWVTAATGFAPPRHGVGGVESAVLPGMGTPLAATGWSAPLFEAARALNPFVPPIKEVPVSGVHRKDKAVWEILAEKGVPSYVVNWWATWPADEGPGVRITERALFRLQSGGAADREVFPPERLEDLEKVYARTFPSNSTPGPRDAGPAEAPAMDRFHLELASAGWKERWPLVAVYLNGLDVLAAAPARQEHGRLGALLQDRELIEHLENLDATVGLLADSAGPDDYVILEGDPGRNDPAGGSQGFLLVSGPGVAAGKRLSGSLLDVAPTLLAVQGFPRSREMQGRVLRDCLVPDRRFGGEGVNPVAGFGPRRPPSGGGSEFDPEVLEKLRSLGYIR